MPIVAARMHGKFEASQLALGFVLGWLGPRLSGSAYPYKFARDGLFGSLPSALVFLP
jgi:hypothetical protein